MNLVGANFACGEHRKIVNGFEVERDILNFSEVPSD